MAESKLSAKYETSKQLKEHCTVSIKIGKTHDYLEEEPCFYQNNDTNAIYDINAQQKLIQAYNGGCPTTKDITKNLQHRMVQCKLLQ